MQVHVMLTVDLNRYVSEEARTAFYEHLKAAHWAKLSLTTTWKARFQEGVSAERALEITKEDVHTAAVSAGVSNYEAAAQVGFHEPAVWSHKK